MLCDKVNGEPPPRKSAAPRATLHRGCCEGCRPRGRCRQEAERLSHPPLRHLSQVKGEAQGPEDGRPPPGTSELISAIHIRRAGCVWPLERGHMAHRSAE